MKFFGRFSFFLFLFLASTVSAHHGAVNNNFMYHADQLIEIEGELTEMLWRNPHTRAKVHVADDQGETTEWELDFGPAPVRWHNMGLDSEDFPGRVKVAGYLARRSERTLGVVNFLFPDGREYVQVFAGAPDPGLRWSSTRLSHQPAVFPPEKVAAAEAAANGIFRMWDVPVGQLFRAHFETAEFTQLGASLSESYDHFTDNPLLACRQGMPEAMIDPRPMQISDLGDRIRMEMAQFNVVRIIHLGLDEAPAEAEPSNVGFSIGRWQDPNTLVVETSHVDWPFYSVIGLPQSERVRYYETFALEETNDGPLLRHTMRITDPLIFTEPIEFEYTRVPIPGYEIVPYDCVTEWETE